MGDPVSWFVVEPGWEVLDARGARVGQVKEIVGDTGKDIFNGLAITTGLLSKPRYLPAERVQLITDGRVVVDLSEEAVKGLDEHEPQPPSEQFRA